MPSSRYGQATFLRSNSFASLLNGLRFRDTGITLVSKTPPAHNLGRKSMGRDEHDAACCDATASVSTELARPRYFKFPTSLPRACSRYSSTGYEPHTAQHAKLCCAVLRLCLAACFEDFQAYLFNLFKRAEKGLQVGSSNQSLASGQTHPPSPSIGRIT